MIVEGLVTSRDASGRVNVAPMGPLVEGAFDRLLLRPFQPSTTFANLSATRCGVFHVVDHVDVMALSVMGRLPELPAMEPAAVIEGQVLLDCCRWFEFRVDEVDAREPRSRMPATIVHVGERRPFFGFNRARHAILEAAILATRVSLLPWSEIEAAFRFLEPAVQKTGDAPECRLFQQLHEYVWARKDEAR